MPYIVDGHNLIPHIPGLSLSDPEDEQSLILLVQDFCRIRRKQVDLYFDHAPLGYAGQRKYGTVNVKFSRQGRTADQEIAERLVKLGKSARNWIVVTSDREVAAAASAARANVMPSAGFARELWNVVRSGGGENQAVPDEALSEEEISDWMQLFQRGKK